MDITFLGRGGFRVAGKQLNLVIDAPEQTARLKADGAVLTDPAYRDRLAKTEAVIIDGPGEYEIKGGLIVGVPAALATAQDEDRLSATIYRLEIDGIRLAVLGNIKPKLSDKQLEELGQVDALIVPVGGGDITLSAQQAAEVVSQLEPKYVIPSHYDDGKSKYESRQDKLDVFLREMGAHPEPQPKLKITGKDIPEETAVVTLEVSA